MITAKYDWKLLDSEIPEDFLKLTKKLKLDKLAAQVLWSRDLRTKEALESFLSPSLEQLHNPFSLHDMEKAVTRILSAVENGEKILIYGDYDADGMTSASIMKSALDEIGADEQTQVYLPNRFTDGYGPNLEVYKYWIEKEKIRLIITVDNGVSGYEEIAWAQAQGVDVIVTDHHSLPEKLPDAFAIIHPRHPEGEYPFSDLCGAGVAFKVACALLESIPLEMLDLVAIGTIADMVSLTDENRVLVSLGLQELRNTDRAGLLELMRLSGVNLELINEEVVGFQIAPRLNALGRMDDPNSAVELLLGWDEEQVAAIAKTIDQKNQERRKLVDDLTKEALGKLTDAHVQVIYGKAWHKGVLGIVAGRLLEKVHKPVIVLSEEDGILKGSGRSIEGFDIFETLAPYRELFIAFGGHSQACGMTIAMENLEELKKVLTKAIEAKITLLEEKKTLELPASLTFDEMTLEAVNSLARLSPFGMDNPKPYFLLENFKITQAKTMGAENKHLKLRIAENEESKSKALLDAVYFGHGQERIEFEQVKTALAVGFSINSWNGKTTVQLMVEDAKATEIELIDLRGREITYPEGSDIFENNFSKNDIIGNILLVREMPSDNRAFERLKTIVQSNSFSLIFFENRADKKYYLSGIGTREQYAKLYKTIFQYPEFDVRHKLKALSDFLKIPEILLVKMIQIFEELGFVIIEDGMMKVVKEAEKHEISESKIYQDLVEIVALQELFALSPVKEIYQKLQEN